jgi:outer membrane protein assembly factor BamE
MTFIRFNPALVRTLRNSMLLASGLLLGACSSWSPSSWSPLSYAPNFSWTYRIDVQQGTVVTQEMADKLQAGMTRDQVRFILGTPLVADLFHTDRWDYPFRFQPGRGDIVERKFSVYFQNNQMARFESDPLPTEEEFRKTQKAGELPPPPDDVTGKSLWQRLKGVFGV